MQFIIFTALSTFTPLISATITLGTGTPNGILRAQEVTSVSATTVTGVFTTNVTEVSTTPTVSTVENFGIKAQIGIVAVIPAVMLL